MNAKTLKALKGSIKKWEKIVAGTGTDNGRSNCPLCKEFADDLCKDCPVKQVTGFVGCLGTPWREWASHKGDNHDDAVCIAGIFGEVLCPTCRKLARAELRFLKSLLPKVKK